METITLFGDEITISVCNDTVLSKTALEEELVSLVDSEYLAYPIGASPELKSAVDMYNEPIVARNIMNENRRVEINKILTATK